MAGQLITFPIRLGLRAAGFAAREGLQASERVISVVSFLVKSASGGGSDHSPNAATAYAPAAEQRPATEERPAPATEERPEPATERPAADTTPPRPIEREPAGTQLPPENVPAHVSEEPTLVEEFAEPGAEDGAGAQVNIAEPWEGYAQMNAKEIIARVSDANAVELAAMQLYEAAHRSRETVMTAVERELRAKSGRGAATADKTRKEHTNGG
jgi:hypothetical protein